MPTPTEPSRSGLLGPALLLLAFAACFAGCKGEDRPAAETSADSGGMRSVLVEALEAWKKGQAKGLARRKPPIRLADDDLAEGYQLVDYSIDQGDAPIEANRDVAVSLSLRDAKGNAVRREARYQVATKPSPAVLRSDR